MELITTYHKYYGANYYLLPFNMHGWETDTLPVPLTPGFFVEELPFSTCPPAKAPFNISSIRVLSYIYFSAECLHRCPPTECFLPRVPDHSASQYSALYRTSSIVPPSRYPLALCLLPGALTPGRGALPGIPQQVSLSLCPSAPFKLDNIHY